MSITKPLLLILMLQLCGHATAADVAAALAAFHARNYETASAQLAAVLDQQTRSEELMFAAAVSEFRTGNVKVAQDYLDALFEQRPDHLEGLFLQGMLHMARLEEVSVFRKLGVAKSARESWQSMVDIDPDSVSGNYALFSFYINAPGIAGGSKTKAEAIVPALVANDPMYANLAQGMLAEKEDDLTAAEHHFRLATEVEGNRATPWFGLARFYYDHDRFDEALHALRQFEQRNQLWHDPDAAMTHFYRGLVLKMQGKNVEARSSLELALASQPNSRVTKLVNEAIQELDNS